MTGDYRPEQKDEATIMEFNDVQAISAASSGDETSANFFIIMAVLSGVISINKWLTSSRIYFLGMYCWLAMISNQLYKPESLPLRSSFSTNHSHHQWPYLISNPPLDGPDKLPLLYR